MQLNKTHNLDCITYFNLSIHSKVFGDILVILTINYNDIAHSYSNKLGLCNNTN